MKVQQGLLSLSASDVSNAFSCEHKTALDLSVALGERVAPSYFDSMSEVLRERGLAHEKRYVDSLRAQGLRVVEIPPFGEDAVAATTDAMQSGADAIVQASLRRGPWNGRADVLLRASKPSALGAWSYEPVDTKLAQETRAASILQLALYAELLSDVLGGLPERFCIVVPGEEPGALVPKWERVDDYHAYFRYVRDGLAKAASSSTSALLTATYPEPVEHCGVCRWWEGCDSRRRADDHLSLVAGITRRQRDDLGTRGVTTLKQLAEMQLPTTSKQGSPGGLERVRDQARMQHKGRTEGAPVFELRPIEPPYGLAALPEPSPGDVFLDLEGDAFAEGGGREYLFGLAYLAEDGELVYQRFWAGTRAEERAAFELLIDVLLARWERHADMHVYHYAPYEPTALKRLMGRYATRQDELDRLLRGERFVDLFRVVKRALVASVEHYSIKDLEAFYGFQRSVDLRIASRMRRSVELAIELGALETLEAEIISAVEVYNRDDCFSTVHLRGWLETLRAGLVAQGVDVSRPVHGDGRPGEQVEERQAEAVRLASQLLEGLPDDRAHRSAEQQACWLLAHMLEFHRREDKVAWWEFFRLGSLGEEELLEERAGLAGLVLLERQEPVGRRKVPIDRYTYPAQECDIREGMDVLFLGGDKLGKVEATDRAARTVDIRRRKDHGDKHPGALFAHEGVLSTTEQHGALMRLARWVADNGIDADGPHRAARDLLLGRAPRLRSASLWAAAGESTLDLARRVVTRLDATVLPIQGPPGAGKTFTAKHMILELLRAGKKVGITAVGHKVIEKLLRDVVRLGEEQRADVRALAKTEVQNEAFETTTKNDRVVQALADDEVNVVGGTVWLWSREDCAGLVDVLFVDEAGQMGLPDVLAAMQAAESVVLLGDPQQLEHPLQGSHPDGVDVSALHHVLGDHKTIPEDAGIFLDETWRLAPAICALTSELFYEGRLHARRGLERHALGGTNEFDGAGLWYAPTPHVGCRNSSLEEVRRVEGIVRKLLTPGAAWVDSEARVHPLQAADILVVAPYNAQVALLAEHLANVGVRVGTVDKFQGQEAPVVIYTMTTSTPEDAPRGMEFLYSPNRLNVATSRAQCACFLVASPSLFEPTCRTVRHVKLANAFCRYLEVARTDSFQELAREPAYAVR